jgi:hypothetical protein
MELHVPLYVRGQIGGIPARGDRTTKSDAAAGPSVTDMG